MTKAIDDRPEERQSAGGSFDAPRLTDEQAGAIRHVDNLSRLPRGDWRHMAGSMPFQEDFSAYRYQLGYASLAMALAHYHQLPAAPGVFKGLLDRLIQRMLEPDVWLYWRDTSTAGGYGPFAMPRLPSRSDPVAVDNIMYSAYLQVMTLMYTAFFDDRKYEEPGSITFGVRPVLWGRDRQESFEYDQRALNERIYWNMVENGYLGVPCEPFCVFQVCNQVPILGFRLHDHIYGGETAREVTEGYLQAWKDFGGGVNGNGHFVSHIIQRNELQSNDRMVDRDSAWTDGWLGMLLNMWRPELVASTYREKIDHWLERTAEGTISVKNLSIIPGSQHSAELGILGEMGWLAGWASEMGDQEALSGMLRHADTYMNPKWEDGGLFYPRHDTTFNADGHFAAMPPVVSNALLPYARLNVADGLRTLFERPWTERERERPALVEVDRHVDVRRAWYDETSRQLQLTVSPMHGVPSTTADLGISRVWSGGDWSLKVDGATVARGVGGAVECEASSERFGMWRDEDMLRLSFPLHGARDVDLVWGRG